jgi:hypothetical protein
MNKNKIIATAVILFLFLIPFKWGYLSLENEGGIVSALCMGFIIIAAVVAVIFFNKNTGESHN